MSTANAAQAKMTIDEQADEDGHRSRLVPLLSTRAVERAPHSILIWLVLDRVRLDDDALPIGVSHACW